MNATTFRDYLNQFSPESRSNYNHDKTILGWCSSGVRGPDIRGFAYKGRFRGESEAKTR